MRNLKDINRIGWWFQDESGVSFSGDDPMMIWGDSVADIMDNALAEIREVYKDNWGRNPTDQELIAGLYFSLGMGMKDE